MCLKLSTSGRMEESDAYPNVFQQINKIKVPMEIINLLTLNFPTTVQYSTVQERKGKEIKEHRNETHN